MSALAPGEIRARRRPWLVLGVAVSRILMGFCLAWPLSSLVASSGVGQRPEGDRVLFEGGGYLLLEVIRLRGDALEAVFRGLLPTLVLGLLLTVACNAALLVALNLHGRLRIQPWLTQTLSSVPALVVLALGTGVAQLLVLLAGLLLSNTVPSSLAQPVTTSATQLGLWTLVGLAAGALGGISDVAKAALVRSESGLAASLRHAFACTRRAPFTACLGWLPYALAFVAAVTVSSQLTSALDVSGPGTWRVLAVFALHQVVILASVALRTAWYARALRLVASS